MPTPNDFVQQRIAAAVQRRELRRQRRAELGQARTRGLAARHAAKLRRQDDDAETTTDQGRTTAAGQ